MLSLNSLVENVQTFFRKCSKCDLCFRYQEYSDGYHNYNDTFLLIIPFRLFLRDCLQQHIPVGSISKVIQSRLNVSLDSQLVLNVYLHFESLVNHQYEFSCVLCGFHPKIMIMDLNKKISSRCSAEKFELPDDYDEDL